MRNTVCFTCKKPKTNDDRSCNACRYKQKRKYYLDYHKRYAELYPVKVKARILVAKAVKDGIIKKLPCKICGDKKTTGHHPDYSKPLKVVWLCQPHHQQEHQRLMKLLNNKPEKKEEDEERIHCGKCGRFVECSSYISEGGSEMEAYKCSCGNEWSEYY